MDSDADVMSQEVKSKASSLGDGVNGDGKV